MTFTLATIAGAINANNKANPNPNINSKPKPYPSLNQKTQQEPLLSLFVVRNTMLSEGC